MGKNRNKHQDKPAAAAVKDEATPQKEDQVMNTIKRLLPSDLLGNLSRQPVMKAQALQSAAHSDSPDDLSSLLSQSEVLSAQAAKSLPKNVLHKLFTKILALWSETTSNHKVCALIQILV